MFLSTLCLLQKISPHMLEVLTKFKTLQTFKGQIVFQEFIQMLLIMSVFWKKIEFSKGESNCEAIIIVLMVCEGGGGWVRDAASLPQQAGFSIMKPFPPAIFSPSPWKTYRGIVTWNGTWKSKNSLKYEQQNELILKGILKNFLRILQEFAIHDYKSLPQAENF